jgi:hypothetical protein
MLDDVGVAFAPQQRDEGLITAGATGSEKADPFAGTARRFYGLDAGG